MQGRRRSPANRYRFGPEGSGRKYGFRGSGNRFNRGFGCGRGRFRPFWSPEPSNEPSTCKGGDILMKAGRLAAEHLVSKGMMSPDVLSGKWRNGSLKKQGQDFQELRGDGNGDGVRIQQEGRILTHSRLREAGLDPGSDRRRYGQDYSPRRNRNHGKASRRGGTFRGSGSDWGREHGRYSVSSDRSKGSTDGDDSSSAASGHDKDFRVKDNENVTGKSGQNESELKADGSECEIEKHDLVDEMTLMESSSGAEKDGLTMRNHELGEDSTLLSENIQVIDGAASEEFKEKAEEDLLFEHSVVEVSHSGNSCNNLLGFCNSVKVPTRSRSSLMSKDGPVSSSADEHKSNIGLQVYDSAQGSFGDTTSHMTHNAKAVESDVKKAIFIKSSEDEKELGVAFGVDRSECIHSCIHSRPVQDTKDFSVQPAENAGNADSACGLEQGKCTRSKSFPPSKSAKCTEELTSTFAIEQSKCFSSNFLPEKDFFHQDNQELSHESPSCATVQERTNKRALEDSDTNRGMKKMREWLPPLTQRTDEHLHFSNQSGKIQNSKGVGNPNENMLAMDNTQEGLVNISEFPMHGREEHFFPDLFKMYDADVMDTSHTNGSHHKDPNPLFPSMSGTKKAIPMDIDFSMSSNTPGQYSRLLTNGKEVEVIDLEDDSSQEVKLVNYVEMAREAVFSDVEAYSNHTPNSGAITGVQDNCDGLMISEFLDSFQNCAPAPAEEGMLGDYNSVNTSLDEIPLGFFPAWEQPPSSQEYDKHL